MKILYVEDEQEMAHTVQELLRRHYLVDLAFSAKEADDLAYINSYDLIILDVMLPDMNGIDLCINLRKNGIRSYILMLTGDTHVDDKVLALNEGADDYITKPFHDDELQARIRALTRRKLQEELSNTLTVGDVSIDTIKKIVRRGDKVIELRRKEYFILEYLLKNSGKIITRGMLLDNIWDSAYESIANTVDVHIKYLRDKIDRPFERKLIKTIYGVGYRFEND